MTITRTSKELTKEEKYLMTKSPSIVSIKDIPDNTEIQVYAWCEYSDISKDGEETDLLSIMDNEFNVYACQSATFKRNFFDLVDIFEDEMFTIKKLSGTTNAGRPYINCDLVITR